MSFITDLARALEHFAAGTLNKTVRFQPVKKGEKVLVEDVDGKALTLHKEIVHQRAEACASAQDLYCRLEKLDAMRKLLWSNLKLDYPDVSNADQKNLHVGLRRRKDGRVVIVGFRPQQTSQLMGMPGMSGGVPPRILEMLNGRVPEADAEDEEEDDDDLDGQPH